LGMVTYGLPVVYALNINLINYGKNRFSLIMKTGRYFTSLAIQTRIASAARLLPRSSHI
jgi:hypothetical protein